MTVNEKAYAKINLFLDVISRREDGFHNILSVMHSVSLCDDITLSCEESETTEIILSSNSKDMPLDSSNIVYRATDAYLTYYNIKCKVKIHIAKRIPMGAGLGGGSSDGAATLRALNSVYRLATTDELLEIAASIGSDLPFCLHGGLCLCKGRGEQLEKIDSSEINHFVIAIGRSRVSTPKAYADLDVKYNNFSDRSRKDAIRSEIIDKASSLYGSDIPSYNIFEEVTDIEEITIIKEIMKKNGAETTLMSGSGPSVFGRFNNSEDANRASMILENEGFAAFVCQSVYPEVCL